MRTSFLHLQTEKEGTAVSCIRQGLPTMWTRLSLTKFRPLRAKNISLPFSEMFRVQILSLIRLEILEGS